MPALFTGPIKPGGLAQWAQLAPPGATGLVAPFVLTHRSLPIAAPAGQKLWDHDATSGEFRDSVASRAALGPLREAVRALAAACVVFRTPETYSPSAANRDQLRRFFGELATREAIGAERVWVPSGLWDVRTAIKLAAETGVACAFDPLVRDPNEPPEIYDDLDVTSLYFRIESAGRTGPLRNERLEDLGTLIEHYATIPTVVAFASPARWHDARNLVKLLG